MIQNRPNMENIWASQGGKTPPNQEKILDGWVEEIPLNTIANWIENRQDKALQYLFQFGMAEWSPNTEYPKNALTMHQGICYISKEASKGAEPEEGSIAWSVAFDNYGATEDIRLLVKSLIEEEGKLPLYVSKKNPVMDGPATAPAFSANEGKPSTLSGETKVGFSFKNSSNSGLFKDGDTISIYKEGVVKATFEDTEKDSDVVTRGMLKALLKPFEIPVGTSIITANANNPKTYLGYGEWFQDCQGRAIVGVSADVTVNTPDWVKGVDKTHGTYEHKLTVEELAGHNHSKSPFNKFSSRASDSGKSTINAEDWDIIDQEYSVGNMNAGDWDLATESKSGGDKPHNNVQPSHTKYVWTRIS